MNRLFASIPELFALMREIGEEEWRGIRNTLLYLLLTFYALCGIQWVANGNSFAVGAGFFFWLGGMILLFNFPSLLKIAGAGEILELTRLTKQVPETEGEVQVPAAIENQVSVAVWNITEKLAFLYSICCLLIPKIPIHYNPWLILYFSIGAFVIFLFIWRTGGSWVRPSALIISLVFMIIHASYMFPKIEFYLNNPSAVKSIPEDGILPDEVAMEANEVEQLRQKQRTDALKSAYELAHRWQEQSPGRDLPPEIEEEVAAAKKGITARELRFQRQAEINEKTTEDLEKTKEDFFIHLPDGSAKAVFHSNNDWAKSDFFFPGKYKVTPSDKTFKVATKLSKNVYEEHIGEFTIPDTPNNESVFIFFWSGEKETFILKREEGKKG